MFLWVWVYVLEEGVMDDDVGRGIQGRRCTVSQDARTTKVLQSSVVFALGMDVTKLAVLLSV